MTAQSLARIAPPAQRPRGHRSVQVRRLPSRRCYPPAQRPSEQARRLQGMTGSKPSLCERVDHTRKRSRCASPGVRRRVVIGVVQKQHRAGAGAVCHTRGNRRGCRVCLPVPTPVAPQQRTPAARASDAQRSRVCDAVRRPIERGRAAGVLGDGLSCAPDVSPHLRRRQAQQVAVALAVQRDLVAGVSDLARQRGISQDLLADEEEGRLHALVAEDLQNGRGSLRVGAVVKGERVAKPARGSVLDPERRAQRGPCAGERRQHVPGERRTTDRAGDARGAAAMIGGRDAHADPGNPGGGRGVGALQPRDRPTGDGRQGGARRGSPTPGAGDRAVAAYALAVRHRAVDAGLAAAGAGAAAGAARGGAADARRRPARAAVLRRADAWRARRALRASGDARDRAGHGRNCRVRASAQRESRRQAADDHARAARARAPVHASVSAARVGAFDR